MRLFTAILICLTGFLISGCAVVQIHVADRKDVKTEMFPFGVRVTAQRGAAQGVYTHISGFSVLYANPADTSLVGIYTAETYMADPAVCGLAVIKTLSPEILAAANGAARICGASQ